MGHCSIHIGYTVTMQAVISSVWIVAASVWTSTSSMWAATVSVWDLAAFAWTISASVWAICEMCGLFSLYRGYNIINSGYAATMCDVATSLWAVTFSV